MSGKPIGRERNVVDGEAKIERQGEGLGQGPVGNRQGNTGLGAGPGKPSGQPSQTPRPQQPQQRPPQPQQRPQQSAGQTPGQQQGADKGIVGDLISHAINNNNNNNNNSGGGIFGGGSAGNGGGNNNGGQSVNLGGGSSSGGSKGGKGKKLILFIILVVVVVLLGSCLIRSCFRRGSNNNSNIPVNNNANTNTNTNTSSLLPTGFSFNDVANNYYSTTSWDDNSGVINNNVAAGVPDKLTNILGNGRDVVTVMVYLCGSDLESNYGSATSDLKEMLAAEGSSNVNLIIYTGGTTKWRNNAISSNINQIYQIKDGQLYRLESNAGDVSMTNEDTLAAFIQYCNINFPANRNMLVLWDHGGGSVEGYAHDEKYSYTGSLTLPKLKAALDKGGVDFDFVGFDACLMATVETGLALSNHADYMIASEETEDASGWYYTNWLTALSRNTSISTIELGKVIADDFVRVATQSSPGVGSTLSVTDLGELSTTVPSKLKSFAKKISQMVEATDNASSGSYSTVATSRSKAREFGESYRIDQVDLVDFAGKLGTSESKSLAQAILSAVKYNKVSSNMSSSYGLSIYFPQSNASFASQVSSIYQSIGICDEYTECVQKYASMQMSGQYISGGGSPFNSLFGLFSNGYG
ncbi:MAG: hypothetical protein IKZ95_07650, partial [Lachnospiraceae bacterium]|nr:hypothetical protein [Lachnospiraceae bacterium]